MVKGYGDKALPGETTGRGLIYLDRKGDDMMKYIGVSLGVVLLAVGAVRAMEEEEIYGPRPSREEDVRAWDEQNQKQYGENPDVLLLPGLVADRSDRRVEVRAESTGLSPSEAIEFLLIDTGSSHGYEALLWSYAKPSHVHEALEFIGLQPGDPYNPQALRFFPTGDRVLLEVQPEGSDATFPIERLVWDVEAEDTLPEDGYVFTGSIRTQGPDGDMIYVADEYDPRSVASIFNQPGAVLDVPRQVSQGEAFGNQIVNPEETLPGGELVSIMMEPAEEQGRPPPRKLRLAITATTGTNLLYQLHEKGEPLDEGQTAFAAVMQPFFDAKEDRVARYLQLDMGKEVPLATASEVCRQLAVLEMMGMIQVEPPPEGQLYYRAFLPDPSWSDREKRPSQPWELYLRSGDDGVAGDMVWHEEIWEEDALRPHFDVHQHAVATPADVRERLDIHAQQREAAGKSAAPRVLLVSADPDMRYGSLLAFLRPAMDTHGTVYIFVEEREQETEPATAVEGEEM